ncbi:hypothetical protein LV716_05255 [Flagellimonas sp. HMM57]|uniref:hypothetical protein n=1 Tax=unclassified Flagellimonas TaxID=2644544 RepID=UPI0013CFFE9F|nr:MULTISPECIES: hypothetical protein [unclassified Flagellimonas]UII77179.1 hypothetical protein LV716_05255 [Flagellimonas sp. HMM57]
MKTSFLTTVLLFSLLFTAQSQEQQVELKVGFDTSKVEVKRGKKELFLPVKLLFEAKNISKDSLSLYKLKLKVNEKETDIAGQFYKLHFKPLLLSQLESKESFFLEITKDTILDRKRKLVLEIELSKKDSALNKINKASHKRMEILIDSYKEEKLDGYKYLAYVGTNFDLVEGIRAKDLFFATNVYSQPLEGKNKNVGFYLSLYGNRAFTQTDSLGTIRTRTKVESLTDSTSLRTVSTDFYANKRVTDNIGAYISPLIKLNWFKSNNPNRNINLYYSPSLEFVYRRSSLSFENLNISTNDSIIINQSFDEFIAGQEMPEGEILPSLNAPLFTETFNEYSFNAGIIGLFLSLENKTISVRVHGSVGYASNYNRVFEDNFRSSSIKQRSDIFFSGRAWVTDSKTGITLQAEVTNSAINPRPFFVATLSKAFNFKKIGEFFQPIIKQ